MKTKISLVLVLFCFSFVDGAVHPLPRIRATFPASYFSIPSLRTSYPPPATFAQEKKSHQFAHSDNRALIGSMIQTALNIVGVGYQLAKVIPGFQPSDLLLVRQIATRILLNVFLISFSVGGAFLIQDVLQAWYGRLRNNYPFFKTPRGKVIFKIIAHTIEAALPILTALAHYKLATKK